MATSPCSTCSLALDTHGTSNLTSDISVDWKRNTAHGCLQSLVRVKQPRWAANMFVVSAPPQPFETVVRAVHQKAASIYPLQP